MSLAQVLNSPHLPRRFRARGVVPAADWVAADDAERDALIAAGWLAPLAGGSPDGDDDDAGDDDDDSDDDAAASADDDDGDDETAGDDDDSDDDDAVAEVRAELKTVKAKLADEQTKRANAEKALQRRTRRKQERDGEYKELYEQEKAKRETLERDAVERERRDLVRDVATTSAKARFKNPKLAWALVKDDIEDGDKREDIERLLRKILQENPELKRGQARQREDLNGDTPNGAGKGKARRAADDDDGLVGRARLSAAYGGNT